MIPVRSLAGEKVAVLGLGRSGLSASLALTAGGADVVAWDDSAGQRSGAQSHGIKIENFLETGLSRVSSLVVSPGIPLRHPVAHPVVEMARSSSVEIVGDIDLLARSVCGPRLVGITGTNGKSTVTALLGHLMGCAGENVQVGANIGKPALSLDPLESSGSFVLELSSFQLDLLTTAIFDVGVWINLSPDHLERHGGLEGYIRAKKNLFERWTDSSAAVIGVDDSVSADLAESLRQDGIGMVIPISSKGPVPGGVYSVDGQLYDDLDGGPVVVADLQSIPSLRGPHNWQNAAAAFAAARVCGLSLRSAAGGLANFAGLPHRQEEVAVCDGISYVNDSKATNMLAAAQALACHTSIYWIAGGRAKDLELDSLEHLLSRVVHVFLIGEAAGPFSEKLSEHVPYTISVTLDVAVAQARKAAMADGNEKSVVLLSPACSSFDQFDDFEARGDAFRVLVQNLSTSDIKASASGPLRLQKEPSL